MNELFENIVLRPRFQLDLPYPKDRVLAAFKNPPDTSILVKRIDDHVFIKFGKEEIDFWSPQLHLEINTLDEESSKLYGLFGPNPTLWTFFMFLHFLVATLFVILGIWAYSNYALDRPYMLQVALMFLLIITWIAFYIFGRLGRKKSSPQMQLLHQFMLATLNKI